MKTIKYLSFLGLLFLTTHGNAQITSTFDTDADGWTFYHGPTGTYSTVNQSGSGGNPNGYVSVTYASQISTSAVQYWIAPAKYLGTKVAQCLDMNLKLDLQQSAAGTNSSTRGDVRIKSGNNVMVYSFPSKPAVAPLWTSYTILLNETGGWQWGYGGPAATRDQVKSILSNITAIEVNGTYAANAAYLSGLDNVVLEERSLTSAPAVSSLSATSGKPGQSININGSGFNATASNNVVRFGAVAATITNATATQLTVTIPIGAQYGKIEITNKATGLTSTSRQPFNPLFDGGGRIIRDSFKPRVDITPTTNVQGFTVKDIDGDGWGDLVIASSTTSKTISIYRNLGLAGEITGASFAPVTTVTIPGTSTNYTGVQFVDLDGDGKLDLITSNVLVTFGGAYFITYRNISTPGNIAFEAPETWAGLTDDTPPSLVTDLDGDGRPELVGGEGSYSTGASFWITQNISTPGNIDFGGAVSYFINASNGGFGGASAGDLDGDGKPELMVEHGDRYSIFKNNSTPGSLSLTSLGMITSGQYITSLQAVDFNLDGKNDLIWKNNGVTLYVRLNTNSGAPLALTDFTTEVTFAGDLNSYGGFSIADINGDGKPDIAASEDGDLGVYENTFSGGTFDATSIIPAYQLQGLANGTYPTSPVVADLNGDSKPELLVATTNIAIRISIFENKNLHAPVISVNTVSPLAGPIGSTVTITGNNFSTTLTDNKVWFGGVEATVLTATPTTLTVSVPAGAGYAPVSVTKFGLTSRYRLPFKITFSPGVTFNNAHFAPPVNFTLTGANYNLDIGDLNHDGKPDIIAGGAGSNTYAFRNLHTTGAITNTSLIADDTIANSLYPRLEDLDGDGYFDVMSVNGPLRKNTSTLAEISFLPEVNVPLGASVVDFADFNNDGKTDMTLTTDLSGAGDLIVLENRTANISGNFVTGTYGAFSSNFIYNKPSANGSTITGDFDGDGFADIVTTNPATDNISIYRNLGMLKISQAQFATRVDVAVGDDPNRIYKGDFDSDGKLDLLVYHWTGTSTTLLIVLQNTSTVGNISFSRIDLTNPNAVTVAHVADLDGDGKPEILTTAEANNQFSIFKNLHTSGALTAASFGVPFSTAVTAPRGITTADINLDGKPEIILTRAAGLLVVYENLITPIGPPTITSFTPASAPVGATITITGTNFDPIPANNIVYFGATRATVSTSTTTQLTVTVPTDATYSPIMELNATTNLLAYSMRNFTPTFLPSKGNITASDFEPKVDFTTGLNPLSVSIGDLDGDGKSDLAVANTASNTISVLRNTSTGTGNISYAAKADFPADNDPESVLMGDFDGDGKVDLSVANYIGFSVSVFRNTSTGPGNISYAAKIDFATGFTHRSSSISDVDGDGKVDIVAANDNAHSISILRNTSTGPGNINYAAKIDFSTGAGSGPYAVTTGDVDGDAKPDVVVPNFNTSTVSIFRNISTGEGSINFDTKVDFPTGTNPISISVGDLDGDGKADLVVVNKNSDAISVFRNTSTGAGNISYAAKVDFPVANDPRSVSIGDLNGDGKADLAIVNYVDNSVSVLRNTSTGPGNIGYAAKVDFTTGTNPTFISIGDSDGDGKSDLVVTNASGNSVSVIRNNPVFAIPTISSFTPASGPVGTSVVITGTNFDTTPANNIVYFGATRATVTTSTATQLTVTVPVGATYYPMTVSVNGHTLHAAKPFTVTFSGGGTIDNCSFAPSQSIATVGSVNRSVLCDVDGDGNTDLLVPDRTNDRLSVFRNTSVSGIPSFAAAINILVVDDPVSSAAGDIDGDGKPDVAVVNYVSGEISVFKNQSTPGNISFGAKVDFTIPSFSHDVSIVDVDGDGKLDLAVTTSLNGFIVFRNTGTPGVINASTFAAGVTFTTGPNAYPSVLGDIDGDGKIDAAIPNANAYTVTLLRNTSIPGSVSFAAATTLTVTSGTPPAGVGTSYTALGDMDGDAKLDLIVTTNTVFTISFYRNTSTPGTFSFDPKFDITSTALMLGAAVSDLDGDGKIDLVIDRGLNGVGIFKNTATSGLINAASFAAPVEITRAASGINLIGDIDGDGRNDILSTHTNVQLFKNLIGTLSAPTITNFTPGIGLDGTDVTINGTNLLAPFSTEVRFNGTLAVISNNTATSIQTEVPVGATTGLIQVKVGCNTVNSSSNFTVAPPPTITINPQPVSTEVCEGGIASFTLTASGTTNLTYQWQKFDGGQFSNLSNSGGYSGTTTPTLTINTTGNFGEGDYRCSVSGDNTTTVFSQTALLTFGTNTTVAEITVNGGTLTASPGDSYQWYQDGEEITGATNQTLAFNVLEYGLFTVAVTDNGCTAMSDEFTYLITGFEKGIEGLKVYPNPVEENLTLEYRPPYMLYVVDVTGKIVHQVNVKTESTSIDLSTLSKGLYLLQLKNSQGQVNVRISKK